MYVNEKTEGRKQNPLSRAIKMEIVFFRVSEFLVFLVHCGVFSQGHCIKVGEYICANLLWKTTFC